MRVANLNKADWTTALQSQLNKENKDDEESRGLFSFGPAQGSKQRIWSHAAFTSRKAIGALPVGNLYPPYQAYLPYLAYLPVGNLYHTIPGKLAMLITYLPLGKFYPIIYQAYI